jgi:hypothetical protein
MNVYIASEGQGKLTNQRSRAIHPMLDLRFPPFARLDTLALLSACESVEMNEIQFKQQP